MKIEHEIRQTINSAYNSLLLCAQNIALHQKSNEWILYDEIVFSGETFFFSYNCVCGCVCGCVCVQMIVIIM